jgi:dihydroorotate dehydrogenase (NAD+) catalytic subunit
VSGGTGFRPMADLSVELFGRVFKNPVANASGTLGYGREIEPLWSIDTLGAYVTKGLSALPHHGNAPPRTCEERGGMINSIGLQNVGLDRFFAEHFPFFVARKTPLIVNFFGFSEDEYIECASRIKPHELIAALEINLSCPNIKQGGLCMGKEARSVSRIIKAVKQVTVIPLVAKLTPEVTDIVEIARAAYEAGADGITLLNTMPALAVNVAKGNIFLKGGLSGPPLKPIALRAVSEVSNRLPLPVIGAGGIMDWSDALAFLMAGASMVQVGTATFVDPFAIPKIIRGIDDYMEKNSISRLSQITGIARC